MNSLKVFSLDNILFIHSTFQNNVSLIYEASDF